MSNSFTDVNLGQIDDTVTVNIGNGEMPIDQSPFSCGEEQNSDNNNNNFGSSSSDRPPADGGLHSSSDSMDCGTNLQPDIEKTFTERYLDAVINRLREYILDSRLSRIHVRSYNSVATFKDGVATIEMPLFAEMHKYAIEALNGAKEEVQRENEEQQTNQDEDTEIEIDLVRKLFLELLTDMINGIVEIFHSQIPYYRGRHFSEIQDFAKRVTKRLVEDSFKDEKDCFHSDNATTSIDDLNLILLHDFEVWVSGLLPYINYIFSSQQQLNLVWCWNSSVDKEDMAFRIYSIVSRINLLEKESGAARGVIFPVNWLHALLHWLCTSDNEDSMTGDKQVEEVPPPGPFNTFQLVELSSEEPVKHILREGNEAADVIPEELFDYLWTQFGGGPKYLVKGAFKMRHHMKEYLKPERFSIGIVFEGINEEPILVENVLRRADLLEVARRALQEIKQQCSESEGIEIAQWCAALCKDDKDEYVDVFLTHLRGQGLKNPCLIPYENSKSVGGVLDGVNYSRKLGIKVNSNNNTSNSTNDGSSSTGGGGGSGSSSKSKKKKGTMAAKSTIGIIDVQLQFSLQRKLDRSFLERCGVCGLVNVGNTCYMNSALQCLSNLRGMRDALFSLPISDYANPSITKELVNLLLEMWSGCSSTVDTRGMKLAIGREVRRFNTYEQQDAMEFIEVLLDRVHEELNAVCSKKYRERLDSDKSVPSKDLSTIFWKDFLNNNRSFIPELFFHQSKTRLQCLTCGETSIVFDNNPSLAATVITLPKKYEFPVSVLMPSGVRVQLYVKVPCNEDGLISVDSVEEKVTLKLTSQAESSVADATIIPTTTTISDNANNSSNKYNDITTTSTSTTIPNDNSNGNGINNNTNNNNNNNNTDSGTISELHLPDGYRIIMYVGSTRTLEPGHQMLYCAAVPIRHKPTQECDSNMLIPKTAKEEENKNENREEKEENDEERGRYLWFFLTPAPMTTSSPKLCHVECLPATMATEHLRDQNYPINRGTELGKRFLKWKPQRKMERRNKIRDLQRYPQDQHQQQQQQQQLEDDEEEEEQEEEEQEEEEEQQQQQQQQQEEEEPNTVVNDDFCRYISVNYQPSKYYGESHTVAFNAVDARSRREMSDSTRTHPYRSRPKIIISYDSEKLEENDTLRDVIHPSARATTSSISRRNTSYYGAIEDTVSLETCLRSTFSPETLAGDDARYCSKCKMLRDSKVERSLFLLPPCLIVSLKRFKVRLQEASKNNTPVEVSRILDVAPFLDAASDERNTKYKLRGVVFHSGSISFGHYTASALNDSVNKWIYYDDTCVSFLPNEHSMRDAYIMFYERVERDTNECKQPMSEKSRL